MEINKLDWLKYFTFMAFLTDKLKPPVGLVLKEFGNLSIYYI